VAARFEQGGLYGYSVFPTAKRTNCGGSVTDYPLRSEVLRATRDIDVGADRVDVLQPPNKYDHRFCLLDGGKVNRGTGCESRMSTPGGTS